MPHASLIPLLLLVPTMVLTACTNPVPASDQQVGRPSTVDIGVTARIHSIYANQRFRSLPCVLSDARFHWGSRRFPQDQHPSDGSLSGDV